MSLLLKPQGRIGILFFILEIAFYKFSLDKTNNHLFSFPGVFGLYLSRLSELLHGQR